jgi:MarR family
MRKIAKIPARRPKKPAELSAPAAGRPPPPGEGKRGEGGYLAYLLRQAQAATRLTMERALADLGATPPQFIVLTMLKAYPGLSGADLARVALLTPQTVGVIIRNLERSGAIRKTPHPVHGRILQWTLTRRSPARRMPGSRPGPGTAACGGAERESAGHGPALAVQNRHRFAG